MKRRRWQVVFQERRAVTMAEASALQVEISGDGMAAVGLIHILVLEFEDRPKFDAPAEVRSIFAGFYIRDVRDLGLIIDPNQSVYDREEAAEYLRVSPSHIDTLMKTNVLPKSQKGFPMFHRTHLDKVWSTRMAYDETPGIRRAA